MLTSQKKKFVGFKRNVPSLNDKEASAQTSKKNFLSHFVSPDKKSELKELYHFYKDMFIENKKNLLHVAFHNGVSSGLNSLMPMLMAQTVKAGTLILKGSSLWNYAWVGAIALANYFSGKNGLKAELLQGQIMDDICIAQRQKLSKSILKSPTSFLNKKTPAYCAEMSQKCGSNAAMMMSSSFNLFYNLVGFSVSAATVLATNPYIFSALIGLTGLNAFISKNIQKITRPMFKESYEKSARISSEDIDILNNTSVVQENNKVDYMVNQLGQKRSNWLSHVKSIREKCFRIFSPKLLFSALVYGGCNAAALYQAIQSGDISSFIAISGSSGIMFMRSNALTRNYQNLIECNGKYQDARKALTYSRDQELQTGHQMINEHGDIQISNVVFRYPDMSQDVFNGLNLTIKAGENVVIVGSSGSGKTSIAKLIKHEYDIQSGSVSIDGIDVRLIKADVLNDHIAYVPQRPQFFNTTLQANLSFVKPNASNEEIEKCARDAGLSDVLDDPDKGLSMEIGPDGANLSAGQRQRLAIARAFLKDTPIVIMDEPTANLDRALASEVLDNIRGLGKNKTVIMITHNPTEIAMADRAIVLNKGQILEDGAPKELIKNPNGYLRQLYKHEFDLLASIQDTPTLNQQIKYTWAPKNAQHVTRWVQPTQAQPLYFNASRTNS